MFQQTYAKPCAAPRRQSSQLLSFHLPTACLRRTFLPQLVKCNLVHIDRSSKGGVQKIKMEI